MDRCTLRKGTVLEVRDLHAQIRLEPLACGDCPIAGGCSKAIAGPERIQLGIAQHALCVGDRVQLRIDENAIWRHVGMLCASMTVFGAMTAALIAWLDVNAAWMQALAFVTGATVAAWLTPAVQHSTDFEVISSHP